LLKMTYKTEKIKKCEVFLFQQKIFQLFREIICIIENLRSEDRQKFFDFRGNSDDLRKKSCQNEIGEITHFHENVKGIFVSTPKENGRERRVEDDKWQVGGGGGEGIGQREEKLKF
jgi:hypothetical protein